VRVLPCPALRPVSLLFLVALTGIEPATLQFSSVQLGLSGLQQVVDTSIVTGYARFGPGLVTGHRHSCMLSTKALHLPSKIQRSRGYRQRKVASLLPTCVPANASLPGSPRHVNWPGKALSLEVRRRRARWWRRDRHGFPTWHSGVTARGPKLASRPSRIS